MDSLWISCLHVAALRLVCGLAVSQFSHVRASSLGCLSATWQWSHRPLRCACPALSVRYAHRRRPATRSYIGFCLLLHLPLDPRWGASSILFVLCATTRALSAASSDSYFRVLPCSLLLSCSVIADPSSSSLGLCAHCTGQSLRSQGACPRPADFVSRGRRFVLPVRL